MILTNKQAMMLYQIGVDSLSLNGIAFPFRLDADTRHALMSQILNQQSDKLINLEENKNDV